MKKTVETSFIGPGEKLVCPNCDGSGDDTETMICVMCGGDGVLENDTGEPVQFFMHRDDDGLDLSLYLDKEPRHAD